MITTTDAIVLHTLKYGDQKIIVDFYTEALGRVSSMIKLSVTKKGKMRKQLFQPLTLLTITVDFRPRQQFQRLSDVQMLAPWQTLCYDPVKTSIGIFLAEVLYNVARQEQADDTLFRFVRTSMEWFDLTTSGVANFHIAFLIQLTRFLGWDIKYADDAWKLGDILQMTIDNAGSYELSRSQRQAYLHLILKHYENNVPSFPQLQSLAILQQIFD